MAYKLTTYRTLRSYKDERGFIYPALHTVLDVIKPSSFYGAEDAARRGTEMHECVAKLLQNEEVIIPPEYTVQLTAWQDWWEKQNYKVDFIERSMVAPIKNPYVGTIDCIVQDDIGPCIIDWKTGQDFYPVYDLQMHGYMIAAEIPRALLVRLGNDGSIEEKEIKWDDSMGELIYSASHILYYRTDYAAQHERMRRKNGGK